MSFSDCCLFAAVHTPSERLKLLVLAMLIITPAYLGLGYLIAVTMVVWIKRKDWPSRTVKTAVQFFIVPLMIGVVIATIGAAVLLKKLATRERKSPASPLPGLSLSGQSARSQSSVGCS